LSKRFSSEIVTSKNEGKGLFQRPIFESSLEAERKELASKLKSAKKNGTELDSKSNQKVTFFFKKND